jgi:EpsI family protein
MKGATLRFVLAALMIGSTAIWLEARSGIEVFPPREHLASFPMQLGGWRAIDIGIDEQTRQVLGAGDFLRRIYSNPETEAPTIDLFIAYFRSQRSGDTIHSPKNCLPGSGWMPVESQQVMLSIAGHSPFPVNRYVIAKGHIRQLVLYWYWAHDRGVASEYWAKYYLIADSMKLNRSDGSLLRFVTPLAPGETTDAAEQRLLPFVNDVFTQLPSFIPR